MEIKFFDNFLRQCLEISKIRYIFVSENKNKSKTKYGKNKNAMKHIAIKKTSKDGHATILIENYLSEYGVELWRMCYRYNFTPDCPFYTAKDRLLHKPDNRQIRAFFSHFE